MDLGLDFGTTHTVVAHGDRGNYPVVSFLDEDGDARDHFPSVVADDGGTLVYGFAALEAARRGMPSARSFKRLLAEPRVTPDTLMRLGDREVPLFDVLTGLFSAVLDALRTASSIEGRLTGTTPARAMLGVPAQANSAQRFLTLEACRRAGFDVAGLVNEPSAASFEFAHRQARSITSRRDLVIVYDLGGGTFDASLLRLSGTHHEVLDSFGVNRLGGDDFDQALAEAALQVAGRVGDGAVRGVVGEPARGVPRGQGAHRSAVTPGRRRGARSRWPGQHRGDRPRRRLLRRRDATGRGDDRGDGAAGAVPERRPTGTVTSSREWPASTSSAARAACRWSPGSLRSRFGRRVHRSPMPSASTAVGLAIAADPDAGFSLRDRLSRGFGVFREREGGAAVSFDPVLDRSLRTADALGEPASAEPVVVTRRYQAAHNIGWFRFVEYSSVDDQGEPRGDLAPVAADRLPVRPGAAAD